MQRDVICPEEIVEEKPEKEGREDVEGEESVKDNQEGEEDASIIIQSVLYLVVYCYMQKKKVEKIEKTVPCPTQLMMWCIWPCFDIGVVNLRMSFMKKGSEISNGKITFD